MQYVYEIEVTELQTLLEEGKQELQLLDVRSTAEINQGSIPGAMHFPIDAIPSKITLLNKEQMLVVYCQKGDLSAQACSYLTARGFKNILNLRGGFQTWKMSGLKVA